MSTKVLMMSVAIATMTTLATVPVASATTCSIGNLVCADASGGAQKYQDTSGACLPNTVVYCYNYNAGGSHWTLLPRGVIGSLKASGPQTGFFAGDGCVGALTVTSCTTSANSFTPWTGPDNLGADCIVVTAESVSAIGLLPVTDIHTSSC